MTRLLLVLMVSCGTAWACSPPSDTGGDGGDDGGGDADTDVDGDADSDIDEEPTTCDEASDCDDGIECTQDVCGAGGTCRNIPVDELCPDDQRCIEGEGCREFQCERHQDCDDGVFCNGDERCVANQCFPAESDRDCDDGNDCTEDSCDIGTDQCVHELLPGCIPDGGVDGGPEPFDPEVHYAGSFRVVPVLTSDCHGGSFDIRTLTFSSSSERLDIATGSHINLSQTPRPEGDTFEATFNQTGCGVYRLTGTFVSSDMFNGHWTATFSGSCGMCTNHDNDVTGVRSP